MLSLVDALRLHMLTQANEIGGVNSSPEDRRKHARASRRWSAGRVQHAKMIREQGIFPWKDDEEVATTAAAARAAESLSRLIEDESDGGVHPAILQTAEGIQHVQIVRKQAGLATVVFKALVEVLTSPPRLAMLLLLTLFVVLNRR
jgi:hypothetical protein